MCCDFFSPHSLYRLCSSGIMSCINCLVLPEIMESCSISCLIPNCLWHFPTSFMGPSRGVQALALCCPSAPPPAGSAALLGCWLPRNTQYTRPTLACLLLPEAAAFSVATPFFRGVRPLY